ncbi:sugar phosphate isomerase/epimerase family protein [Deinococcus humi]|uniref:Sugar phosphate isomerase/epimerase n=1 Tax=Deinococcus humi TaxID=662880 RepID=A0A7W8JWG6_9DEIO|nr:sugar phosphate isomerase/epimerase [Deinococcus humi]MBB5362934.1 sugar phosphate isomerase/epimerase [Deinococcus humi]GGO25563.1 sugar phosphate isomerase [Deinococcus humi]
MTQPVSVGLQLYTLREQLAQDFLGTLDAVAASGITEVELAGEYGGMDGPSLRAALGERGLRATAAHIGGDAWTGNTEEQIAFLQGAQVTRAVYPWFKGEGAQWTALADQLEGLAQRLAAEGISLSYHNHDHELSGSVDGQTILDLLLERAPSLGLELDTAWVYAGGKDPVDYLRRYADRTPLVHLKDLRREAGGWRTVELGAGEVPLTAILNAVPAGASVFYEQDQANGLDSLRTSLTYLATLS